MSLTGNKGEWSETYAFMRLLSEGNLFAADEKLNRIRDLFFPIIKIIREETIGTPYEYRTNNNNSEIEIFLNDDHVASVPVEQFDNEADVLLEEINNQGQGSGAFEVPRTEAFIRSIYINKLKAPSSDKSDISVQLHDSLTGYENIVGFSIKSELGMPPTLMNAGKTTNFIYEVSGLTAQDVEDINAISSSRKIKDRIDAIIGKGGELEYLRTYSRILGDNLGMIDSQMEVVVAKMLIGYYSGFASDCAGLTSYVSHFDPLNRTHEFYKHKIKDLLCAIALGMKPATPWNGMDEATGGYIIVKTDGEVLAYHIYNRDSFRTYLINNTKLESGSSSRHEYGVLYEQEGRVLINLNLQIRFV